MDSGERSGRHSAPRHAAPRVRRSSEPVRLDTSHLPSLESHAAPRPRQAGPMLLLALGITAAVVAWGYLVYVAIDFGNTARNGRAAAWWLLALATIGAIACLFVALMLGMRLVARVRAGSAPHTPHPPGGRRAAR